ncbi:MAG: hypothetical protein SF053_18645 [Bacteroidia bacterium]|nr:hypothetical protein [Bacteroidia bacterium]
MYWVFFLALFGVGSGIAVAQDSFSGEVLPLRLGDDTLLQRVIADARLYTEQWDTLPQLIFWRRVMNLPPDSAVISVAQTRQILGVIPLKRYESRSETGRTLFKDSLRTHHQLPPGSRIYITHGKNDFYSPRLVIPGISRAMDIFAAEGVDPWIAQAILLIESPGAVRRSNKGAYGSFQLMKSVAISQGLVVNKYVDEREDFDKCARAAARFIRKVCIPETERILAAHNLSWNRQELWFRLMVLHVYHAGAGNVGGVIGYINPEEGGAALIQQIWRTEYGSFRNSSQNYSQLALASMLELDLLVALECEVTCQP